MQVLVEDCTEGEPGAMCSGRNEGFHKVHFPAVPVPYAHDLLGGGARCPRVGDYVDVEVAIDESHRLVATPICLSSILHFAQGAMHEPAQHRAMASS
jgi:hypothetical protein